MRFLSESMLVSAGTVMAWSPLLVSGSGVSGSGVHESPEAAKPNFIAPGLQDLLELDGPSVVRHKPHTAHQDFIVDVVSIGSTTRPGYLDAQAETWASTHVAVRNFWGFDELVHASEDDLCPEAPLDGPASCASRDLEFNDPAIEAFAKNYFGFTEGGRDRRSEPGWVCAQRRMGHALGWLQTQYGGNLEAPDALVATPDALIIVDDDTYIDIERIRQYMTDESSDKLYQPLAYAPCLFAGGTEGSGLPFSFAYGGFGLILNAEAIDSLTAPIMCFGQVSQACSSLRENRIGEREAFEEGMSVFELFYRYSARIDYCLHSDWMTGYIAKYYLSGHPNNENDVLKGLEAYPRCGNITSAGEARPCHEGSVACHMQTPKHMESLALSSYVRSRGSFDTTPRLDETGAQEVVSMIAEKEEAARKDSDQLVLPNVLLSDEKATTRKLTVLPGGNTPVNNLDDIVKSYQKSPYTKILWMYWDRGLDHLVSLATSDDPSSEKYKADYKCVQAWKILNPSWHIFVLDKDQASKVAPSFGRLFSGPNPENVLKAHSADLLRVELLTRYGGVWSDTSNCPFKPLDSWIPELLGRDGFFFPKLGSPDFVGDTYGDLLRKHSNCRFAPSDRMAAGDRSGANHFIAASHQRNVVIEGWFQTLFGLLEEMQRCERPDVAQSIEEVGPCVYPYFISDCAFTQLRISNVTIEEKWRSLAESAPSGGWAREWQVDGTKNDLDGQAGHCFGGSDENDLDLGFVLRRCYFVKKQLGQVRDYVLSDSYLGHVHASSESGSLDHFESPHTIQRMIDEDAPSLDSIMHLLAKERGALLNSTTLAEHARLYELTYAFIAAFQRRGVPILLGYGTHIGARRHHGVIPFGEKNVDFEVFSLDVKEVSSIIEATLQTNDYWSDIQVLPIDFGFQLDKSSLQKVGLKHHFDFWLFDDRYDGSRVRCTGRQGADRQNAIAWYPKKQGQTGCDAFYENIFSRAAPEFEQSQYFPAAYQVFGTHKVPIPATSAELETFEYGWGSWNKTCGPEYQRCDQLYGDHPFVFEAEDSLEELRQGDVVLHRSTLTKEEEKNGEPYKFLDDHPGNDHASKFAYATVLGWNPDETQRQLYLEAVLVWIYSLGDMGTDADIIVLLMYHDPEAEELIKTAGAVVKHIDKVEHMHEVEHFEKWFVDIAFAKLRAFQLTEYERVQLMDADVAIEEGKNLDALFSYAQSSRLVSEGLGGDSPLRAGWLMIKPSNDEFTQLVEILKNGTFDEQMGWGNLDLPVEYPGWSRMDHTLKWGFYGSQLEQGLLFHYFCALPKKENPSANTFDLLRLLSDQDLNSYGLVHFYGDRKPWGSRDGGLPDFVKSAQARWHQVHHSTLKLRSTRLTSLFESPLTEVGQQRYLNERVLYPYYVITTAPTSSPSKVPTQVPSASPSASPSKEPTSQPSKSPSLSPVTTSPTGAPSKSPVTGSPTGAPSKSPSTSPTTAAPSVSPTKKPTVGEYFCPQYTPGRAYTSGDCVSIVSTEEEANRRLALVSKRRNYLCKSDVWCSNVGFAPGGTYSSQAWEVFYGDPRPVEWSEGGCPEAYVGGKEYAPGDVVSVVETAAFTPYSIVYACKEAPSNLFCGAKGFEPNEGQYFTQAWTQLGACSGTLSPTTSPNFEALVDVGGCPLEYSAAAAYEEGDTIAKDGLVYECKSYPSSLHCSQQGFQPGVDLGGVEHWKQAWIVTGYCSGTVSPTSSPNYVSLADMGGCPDAWETKTNPVDYYEEGDRVASDGLVFQCKAWPYSGHCGQQGYEPNVNPATPDDWKDAWEVVGFCNGSMGPTTSPVIDPATSVGKCPEEWSAGVHTKFEEGDMVSLVVSAVPLRKVAFKCKAWPYSSHCAQHPPGTFGGDLGWAVAGGCDGSLGPTASPAFDRLSVVGTGCPAEWSPSKTDYEAGDLVAYIVSSTPLRKLVYECKDWPETGFCNQGSGFEPGTTFSDMAWILRGACDGSMAPTDSPVAYSGTCTYERCLDDQECNINDAAQTVTGTDGSVAYSQTACSCTDATKDTTACTSGNTKGTRRECTATQIDPYDDAFDYQFGDYVRVGTQQYRCRHWPNGSWCKQEAFAPKKEAGVWNQAWEKAGVCA